MFCFVVLEKSNRRTRHLENFICSAKTVCNVLTSICTCPAAFIGGILLGRQRTRAADWRSGVKNLLAYLKITEFFSKYHSIQPRNPNLA